MTWQSVFRVGEGSLGLLDDVPQSSGWPWTLSTTANKDSLDLQEEDVIPKPAETFLRFGENPRRYLAHRKRCASPDNQNWKAIRLDNEIDDSETDNDSTDYDTSDDDDDDNDDNDAGESRLKMFIKSSLAQASPCPNNLGYCKYLYSL